MSVLLDASDRLEIVMSTCDCIGDQNSCEACKFAGHISSLLWRLENSGTKIPADVLLEARSLADFSVRLYDSGH